MTILAEPLGHLFPTYGWIWCYHLLVWICVRRQVRMDHRSFRMHERSYPVLHVRPFDPPSLPTTPSSLNLCPPSVTRRLIHVFAPMLAQQTILKGLALAVRDKGTLLVILIRLCPFPFPYSNAFFASIETVSLSQFILATLCVRFDSASFRFYLSPGG